MCKENIYVRELVSKEDFIQGFPVINQLRVNLTLESYLSLIEEMRAEGYRGIALFSNGDLVSYIGFSILTNLYYGKHMWVYDLITDEKHRSNHYGKILLSHLSEFAEENHCNSVALSSGLQREYAHKFYEGKMDFKKASYVFKKDLRYVSK